MANKQSKTNKSLKKRISRRNKIQKRGTNSLIGVLKKYIGGKRKTKKSKAKKDSKKRSSRRNKTQTGGAKTESDMLYDVTEKYDNNEDVNQTDKTGKTFLHRASEKG